MEIDLANRVDDSPAARPIRKRTAWKWSIGIAASLVLVYVGMRFVILDTDRTSQPVCHKGVLLAISNWRHDRKSKDFPNVNGNSAESLSELDKYMGTTRLSEKYNYVPGLREDDPHDLVLMYLVRPTRWLWHAGARTIFREKQWIVVPKDFTFYRDGVRDGELNERMSFAEFRDRLQKTLDFLKKRKRPHWEAVVKEHSEFLAEAERKWDGG